MKILCLSVLTLLVVTGCNSLHIPTSEKYEAILQSWVGSSEQQLISSDWGVPDQVYDAGGGVKYLTYIQSRIARIRGTPSTATTYVDPVTGVAQTTLHDGQPAENYELRCKVTFEVQDSFIVRWRYKGNDCTAS